MGQYEEKPEYYNKGTPEQAVAGWIQSWKDKKWKDMADYVQLTWLSKQKYPFRSLRRLYGNKKLEAAEIVESKTEAGFIVDVSVKVRYRIGVRTKSAKILVRVLREIGPYKPSKDEGQWGINPISTLREVTPT